MRNQEIKSSKVRAILAGNKFELFVYGKKYHYGFSSNAKRSHHPISEEKRRENFKKSCGRTRAKIKRLIIENFGGWEDERGNSYMSKYLTLTFGDNIQNLTAANEVFSLFMKKLNYSLYGTKKAIIQYLGVIEFQERGAIHYHIIFFNLPFVNRVYDVLNKLWGEGHMIFKVVKDPDHAANYLVKYITKDSNDERLYGRKKYLRSRHLKNFLLLKDQDDIRSLYPMLSPKSRIFKRVFEHERLGKTTYLIFKVDENFRSACLSKKPVAK